jgi:hypothetical protein
MRRPNGFSLYLLKNKPTTVSYAIILAISRKHPIQNKNRTTSARYADGARSVEGGGAVGLSCGAKATGGEGNASGFLSCSLRATTITSTLIVGQRLAPHVCKLHAAPVSSLLHARNPRGPTLQRAGCRKKPEKRSTFPACRDEKDDSDSLSPCFVRTATCAGSHVE